ncbi:MAG TPA: VOC family protein [Candidatus Binataceae bacterium]|nr:VOC family protein [Candidatus Binataceae bacterium]
MDTKPIEGVTGIFHVNINCSNFERSLAFYQMLGFKVVSDMGEGSDPKITQGLGVPAGRYRGVLMQIGEGERATLLDLIQWYEPGSADKPYPGLYHLGICRVALETPDVSKVYEQLKARGVEFLSEPKLFSAGVAFACCKDPDGTIVEFINARRFLKLD